MMGYTNNFNNIKDSSIIAGTVPTNAIGSSASIDLLSKNGGKAKMVDNLVMNIVMEWSEKLFNKRFKTNIDLARAIIDGQNGDMKALKDVGQATLDCILPGVKVTGSAKKKKDVSFNLGGVKKLIGGKKKQQQQQQQQQSNQGSSSFEMSTDVKVEPTVSPYFVMTYQ